MRPVFVFLSAFYCSFVVILSGCVLLHINHLSLYGVEKNRTVAACLCGVFLGILLLAILFSWLRKIK